MITYVSLHDVMFLVSALVRARNARMRELGHAQVSNWTSKARPHNLKLYTGDLQLRHIDLDSDLL